MAMARCRASTAGLILAGVTVTLTAWAAQSGHQPQQRAWRDGAGAGAATPRAPANAAGDAAQRVEADRYQPWTTPEGIHMLRVAPAGAMHMSVLRCDNGRLVAAERGRAACADH